MNDALFRSHNRAHRATTADDDVISASQPGSPKASDLKRANAAQAPSQQHRILCVDDEVIGTTMRAEVLRQQGYSVDLYHSPVEALCCEIFLFQLAILDFEMPELNGRELLLRLRALGARFPTVLLTGRLETLSRDDRVLFTRCLDKGMPISRLLDAVRELLDQDAVFDYGS